MYAYVYMYACICVYIHTNIYIVGAWFNTLKSHTWLGLYKISF